MKLKQILARLTELKSEIGEMGKLPKEVLQKINYKFRLDWNYYSNRMEGGTLTREETRSVMVGNITVSGKPIKDVMEMNGHDEVVRELLRMGKGEVRISEKRIKEIHKAIIKETDDSDKNKQIGVWKMAPNEIINYKGEKIRFTAPGDVAAEMHDLLNRTNAQLDAFFANKKDAEHPLIIAADFHLGFVSIHPFFDGNGRTARILMNLILIACGYPPIIINDTDKKAYYQYLADIQAYGGDKVLMYQHMAELLLRSLTLVKDAAEGKDIEEKDDLDKRLDLLKKRTEAKNKNAIQLTKNDIDIFHFLDRNPILLSEALYRTHSELYSLFASNNVVIALNGKAKKVDAYEEIPIVTKNLYHDSGRLTINDYEIFFYCYQYKDAGTDSFDIKWGVKFVFEIARYEVYVFNQDKPGKLIFKKMYHQSLEVDEIEIMQREYKMNTLDEIDAKHENQ